MKTQRKQMKYQHKKFHLARQVSSEYADHNIFCLLKNKVKPMGIKCFTTVLLILIGLIAKAQYGNEWIIHDQQYYKFKVGADGLYRIPKSVLDNAGIGNVGVEFFELWRNGEKVPFYATVTNGPLQSSDYIEFWGQANDGNPDKALYRNIAFQHTTKRSLLTDTAVYFLSVNTNQSGWRYTTINNNVAGNVLPVDPYFMHKEGVYYNNKINNGFAAVVGEYIYSSSYDKGEFWSSAPIRPVTPLTSPIANLQVYSGGPSATLKYGAMGDALNARTLRVTVNGNLVQDTIMNYFVDVHSSVNIPLSYLSSGNISVNFANTSTVSSDRLVISYFELLYPRTYNFSNKKNFSFSLPASGAKYLEITNFDGGVNPILLNLTTGERIAGNTEVSGLVRFAIGAGGNREFVLVNTDNTNTHTISHLTPKVFKQFLLPANQGDYLIITNKVLFNGSNGANPVEEYRQYRSSAIGGGYDVTIIDIDELVDQFGLGIKKNPLSIKNFLNYARANFSITPKFVFIIGRGVTYNEFRVNESNPNAEAINLVPTFGSPGSDNMLSSQDAMSPVPITPIGRLSVVHPYEIEYYLEKVKEYESIQKNAPHTAEGRGWMKNVMHVTGASEPYLGTVLCNYMGVFKNIIADTSFGGNVSTFCKASTNAAEQINSERIAKLFEQGMSIMNYFGHSSTTTLDFNLDAPENYNSRGKYPVFLVNGCNAGNFFTFNTSRLDFNETLSEKFTLARQRGAIAFIASTHYGIVNYLNIYLNHLYRNMAQVDYMEPVSVLTKDALQNLYNTTGPNDYYGRVHVEEIAVHGDPVIFINGQTKPDYVIEEPMVIINPTFISVAESFFNIKLKVLNNGRAVADSIVVEVKRQYPDGTTEIVYREKRPGIRYSDSISLNIPILATRDKGINKIIVTVDADNTVDEISENNNMVTKDVVIFEDEARAVYPPQYAIINNNKQKLYASTANALSVLKTYTFELDTTQLFNSSSKVVKTVSSVGGTLEFDPGITYMDSVVYYWRVGSSAVATGQPLWNYSSFRYINSTEEGFGQSHYFQHANSLAERITIDSSSRKWTFGDRINRVYIRNGVFPTGASGAAELNVTINDHSDIASACVGNSILFNVFDPVTFKPWLNVDEFGNNLYKSGSGNANCGPSRHRNFEFSYMTRAGRKLIMNFMDSIPDGYYVIARSFDTNDSISFSSTWRADTAAFGSNNSVYHRLLGSGMMNIDSIDRRRAWIFMYKKNDYGFEPKYHHTQGVNDRGVLSTVIVTPDTLGTVASPIFGPAKEWKKIIWTGKTEESLFNDNPTVEVVGIDAARNETLLHVLDRNTKELDISSVSASQYPYMRLKMRNVDSITLTPYQLSSWMALYSTVPEGAIIPNMYLQMKDTVEVGANIDFGIAFKNISHLNFDSLALKFYIIDKNNVTHNIVLPKLKPIVSGDTVVFRYTIDSKNFIGFNTLYFEFNPNNDQQEQVQFNNFIFKNFYVKDDYTNPLLDVTFDGVHILNKDIISAKPHIQIRLKDEAKFMLLNDTSLLTVQVRYPNGTVRTHNFDNDTLRFTPAANGVDNTATIDFYPQFLTQQDPEGDEYELIVRGRDRMGNRAGQADYRIAFTIISKAMISNLLNYPNPFSTSTAFVFTLTGSEIPQNMKIQVLTVTGKIVREITKDELGPIRIGRNITEFKWDGTDQFGQKLGNGVYLYRFVTSLNGQRMEKYKAKGDNTDKFFNNGYGKMYLMR